MKFSTLLPGKFYVTNQPGLSVVRRMSDDPQKARIEFFTEEPVTLQTGRSAFQLERGDQRPFSVPLEADISLMVAPPGATPFPLVIRFDETPAITSQELIDELSEVKKAISELRGEQSRMTVRLLKLDKAQAGDPELRRYFNKLSSYVTQLHGQVQDLDKRVRKKNVPSPHDQKILLDLEEQVRRLGDDQRQFATTLNQTIETVAEHQNVQNRLEQNNRLQERQLQEVRVSQQHVSEHITTQEDKVAQLDVLHKQTVAKLRTHAAHLKRRAETQRNHESALAALADKHEDLRHEKKDLEFSHETYKLKTAEAIKEAQAQNEQLADLARKVGGLIEQVDNQHNRRDDQEKRLETLVSQQQAQVLEQKATDALVKKLDQLLQKDIHPTVRRLDTGEDQLMLVVNHLLIRLNLLEKDCQAYMTADAGYLSKLYHRLDGMRLRLDTQDGRLNEMTAEISGVRASIEAIENVNRATTVRLDVMAEQIRLREEEAKTHGRLLSELREQLNAHDNRLEALKDLGPDVDRLRTDFQNLTQTLPEEPWYQTVDKALQELRDFISGLPIAALEAQVQKILEDVVHGLNLIVVFESRMDAQDERLNAAENRLASVSGSESLAAKLRNRLDQLEKLDLEQWVPATNTTLQHLQPLIDLHQTVATFMADTQRRLKDLEAHGPGPMNPYHSEMDLTLLTESLKPIQTSLNAYKSVSDARFEALEKALEEVCKGVSHLQQKLEDEVINLKRRDHRVHSAVKKEHQELANRLNNLSEEVAAHHLELSDLIYIGEAHAKPHAGQEARTKADKALEEIARLRSVVETHTADYQQNLPKYKDFISTRVAQCDNALSELKDQLAALDRLVPLIKRRVEKLDKKLTAFPKIAAEALGAWRARLSEELFEAFREELTPMEVQLQHLALTLRDEIPRLGQLDFHVQDLDSRYHILELTLEVCHGALQETRDLRFLPNHQDTAAHAAFATHLYHDWLLPFYEVLEWCYAQAQTVHPALTSLETQCEELKHRLHVFEENVGNQFQAQQEGLAQGQRAVLEAESKIQNLKTHISGQVEAVCQNIDAAKEATESHLQGVQTQLERLNLAQEDIERLVKAAPTKTDAPWSKSEQTLERSLDSEQIRKELEQFLARGIMPQLKNLEKQIARHIDLETLQTHLQSLSGGIAERVLPRIEQLERRSAETFSLPGQATPTARWEDLAQALADLQLEFSAYKTTTTDVPYATSDADTIDQVLRVQDALHERLESLESRLTQPDAQEEAPSFPAALLPRDLADEAAQDYVAELSRLFQDAAGILARQQAPTSADSTSTDQLKGMLEVLEAFVQVQPRVMEIVEMRLATTRLKDTLQEIEAEQDPTFTSPRIAPPSELRAKQAEILAQLASMDAPPKQLTSFNDHIHQAFWRQLQHFRQVLAQDASERNARIEGHLSDAVNDVVTHLLDGFESGRQSVAHAAVIEAFRKETLGEALRRVDLEVIPIVPGETLADARWHDIRATRYGAYKEGVVVEVIQQGIRRVSDGEVLRKSVVFRGEPH